MFDPLKPAGVYNLTLEDPYEWVSHRHVRCVDCCAHRVQLACVVQTVAFELLRLAGEDEALTWTKAKYSERPGRRGAPVTIELQRMPVRCGTCVNTVQCVAATLMVVTLQVKNMAKMRWNLLRVHLDELLDFVVSKQAAMKRNGGVDDGSNLEIRADTAGTSRQGGREQGLIGVANSCAEQASWLVPKL